MHRRIARALGATLLTLAFAAAPGVAHAQTAEWNEVSPVPAHPDWTKPYDTSASHGVSADLAERAALTVNGDAELAALDSATAWYTSHVAPIDLDNTYAVGDDETQLTSETPTSREWDVWVVIYTIAHPTQGYRYCEFNRKVTATLEQEVWTTSVAAIQQSCHNLKTFSAVAPAPFANMWTTVSMVDTPGTRSTAELAVRMKTFDDWKAANPDSEFYIGGGVNFSTRIAPDTWYVIYTVYQTDVRRYCIDGYFVAWNLDDPETPPTVNGTDGGAMCSSY